MFLVARLDPSDQTWLMVASIVGCIVSIAYTSSAIELDHDKSALNRTWGCARAGMWACGRVGVWVCKRVGLGIDARTDRVGEPPNRNATNKDLLAAHGFPLITTFHARHATSQVRISGRLTDIFPKALRERPRSSSVWSSSSAEPLLRSLSRWLFWSALQQHWPWRGAQLRRPRCSRSVISMKSGRGSFTSEASPGLRPLWSSTSAFMSAPPPLPLRTSGKSC